MREKIAAIIREIRDDIDVENERQLIDDEVLDSFDIVGIVGLLNDEFGISINVNDLVPENFNSLDGMEALVKRLTE